MSESPVASLQAATVAFAKLNVVLHVYRFGWRRYFMPSWYDAVYRQHQLTRGTE